MSGSQAASIITHVVDNLSIDSRAISIGLGIDEPAVIRVLDAMVSSLGIEYRPALVPRLLQLASGVDEPADDSRLSTLDNTLASLRASGKRRSELAAECGLTAPAVRCRLSNLADRLSASDFVEAVVELYASQGIVDSARRRLREEGPSRILAQLCSGDLR